uniref:Uncharacterized protein n=1 Tax=Aegilops tauschii subsp. strangulata TaxID=200361 RepID=A0A453DVY0_AEGTS
MFLLTLSQDMEELNRAIRASEMKQTLISIGFMGAFTGAFAYVLKSDLAAREALRVALDSDQDSTGAAVNAVGTNED